MIRRHLDGNTLLWTTSIIGLALFGFVSASFPAQAAGFSLGAIQIIDLRGNNHASDSFDSENPLFSNNGFYPAGMLARIKASGDVCAGIQLTDSVGIASITIMGSVHTGPGTNTIYIGPNGSVGDSDWVGGGNIGIQQEHSSTDFNAAFPPVVPPSVAWLPLAAAGSVSTNGASFNLVVYLGGNYSLNGLSGNLLVNAPSNTIVNIKISGNVSLSGRDQICITPSGALVRIYMVGSSFSTSGSAAINNMSGYARNFCLYGTPNCTSISFAGYSSFCGCLYAPNADLTLGGGGNNPFDFVGSILSRTVTMPGHYNFHFDEALDRLGVFPARFTAQPTNQNVLQGSNAVFTASADWANSYQWQFAYHDIPDATNAVLSLTNVTLNDAGPYTVAVSNYSGFVTSSVATLTVYSSPAGTLSLSPNTNSSITLLMGGVPGITYSVEASSDLVDWFPVGSGTAPFIFEETNTTDARRFYRSVWSN